MHLICIDNKCFVLGCSSLQSDFNNSYYFKKYQLLKKILRDANYWIVLRHKFQFSVSNSEVCEEYMCSGWFFIQTSCTKLCSIGLSIS